MGDVSGLITRLFGSMVSKPTETIAVTPKLKPIEIHEAAIRLVHRLGSSATGMLQLEKLGNDPALDSALELLRKKGLIAVDNGFVKIQPIFTCSQCAEFRERKSQHEYSTCAVTGQSISMGSRGQLACRTCAGFVPKALEASD